MTSTSRRKSPMIPSTSPAIAIPSPVWRPFEFLIWEIATAPKMSASKEPNQYSQTMPSTRLAIAKPFVLLDSVMTTGAANPSGCPVDAGGGYASKAAAGVGGGWGCTSGVGAGAGGGW